MKTQKNISPSDRAEAVRQIKKLFEDEKTVRNFPWMNAESSADIQLLTARLGLYHVEQPTLAQSDKLYEMSKTDWVAHIVASETAALVLKAGGELKGGLKMFVIERLQNKEPPPKMQGASTNWNRDCMILGALTSLVDDGFSEGLAQQIVFDLCNGETAPDLTRKVIRDIWKNTSLREDIESFEAEIERQGLALRALALFDSIK